MKKCFRILDTEVNSNFEDVFNMKVIGKKFLGEEFEAFDKKMIKIVIDDEEFTFELRDVEKNNIQLTGEQQTELFELLLKLLREKNKQEEADKTDMRDFIDYIGLCLEEYIYDDGANNFYEYVEDTIYHLAAYEV